MRVGGHDVEHVVSCYRVQLLCVFTRGFTPSPTPRPTQQTHFTPLHGVKSAELAKVLLHGKADVNSKTNVSVHEDVARACVYLSQNAC